jgi:VanZ family protein
MKFPGISSNLSWGILAVVYAGIFLTILFLAYTGNLPAVLTQNDKLAHVILYAIATYLGHRVLHRRVRLFRYSVPLFPLLFGLFTLVEEVVQSFSPYRRLDAIDLIASFTGVGLGYWLAERGKRNKGKGQREKGEG